MLTRQITPEAILNLAEALDALGDSLSRDSSRGGEIDTYRFLDGLLATSTTFRREAARLGAAGLERMHQHVGTGRQARDQLLAGRAVDDARAARASAAPARRAGLSRYDLHRAGAGRSA